jgi:hypothetical protein
MSRRGRARCRRACSAERRWVTAMTSCVVHGLECCRSVRRLTLIGGRRGALGRCGQLDQWSESDEANNLALVTFTVTQRSQSQPAAVDHLERPVQVVRQRQLHCSHRCRLHRVHASIADAAMTLIYQFIGKHGALGQRHGRAFASGDAGGSRRPTSNCSGLPDDGVAGGIEELARAASSRRSRNTLQITPLISPLAGRAM